MICFY
jgi:hypothetical protein